MFSENLYNWIMMYIFNNKIRKHVYIDLKVQIIFSVHLA